MTKFGAQADAALSDATDVIRQLGSFEQADNDMEAAQKTKAFFEKKVQGRLPQQRRRFSSAARPPPSVKVEAVPSRRLSSKAASAYKEMNKEIDNV